MAYEVGPKDVVYVGEDEKVRLLCKFQTPSNRTATTWCTATTCRTRTTT